jgi:hypothetical protein
VEGVGSSVFWIARFITLVLFSADSQKADVPTDTKVPCFSYSFSRLGSISRHFYKDLGFESMGAPLGNKNAVKNKPWEEALRRALMAEDGKKLRALAERLITRAEEGDIAALREIGDRIDGKPVQSISGPDGGPIETVSRIERVIVEGSKAQDT